MVRIAPKSLKSEALRQDEVGVRIAVVQGPVALLFAERSRQCDVCLGEEGSFEGLDADEGEALGEGDSTPRRWRLRRRLLPMEVRLLGKETDAKEVAPLEGPLADGGEALGKGDRRQGGGAVEGSPSMEVRPSEKETDTKEVAP